MGFKMTPFHLGISNPRSGRLLAFSSCGIGSKKDMGNFRPHFDISGVYWVHNGIQYIFIIYLFIFLI